MRLPVRTRMPLAVALTASVALAGCGGGSSEGKNAKKYSGNQKPPAQVIDDMVSAAHASNAQKICNDLFTPGLAKAIGQRNKTTCVGAVSKQLVSPKEDITVTNLNVNGASAQATVREQNGNVSRLTLLEQGGKWRVNAIQ